MKVPTVFISGSDFRIYIIEALFWGNCMNNKWYLYKKCHYENSRWAEKNQSQYFHLALCIQIWKIWTFSNTFRLKKKRGSLVWPKLKSTQKVEDMLESQTFVAVHPARGPILLFHRRNSHKRRLKTKATMASLDSTDSSAPHRSMSKRWVPGPAPGWGTAELWGPKKSHFHPSFSECKSTQKMFIYPGLKVGCKNDGLN